MHLRGDLFVVGRLEEAGKVQSPERDLLFGHHLIQLLNDFLVILSHFLLVLDFRQCNCVRQFALAQASRVVLDLSLVRKDQFVPLVLKKFFLGVL